jgi:hypothetical protein
MPQQFDRSAEDLGNAIHLEHVNVQVPGQRLATLFYVTELGLTRDPGALPSVVRAQTRAGSQLRVSPLNGVNSNSNYRKTLYSGAP